MSEIDVIVHKLIHEMIVMAEDDPQVKNSVHLKASMIEHQELIMSVKEAIKPGAFSTFIKPFTKDMLKDYFARIQMQIISKEQIKIKRRPTKKITADMDMKVKSDHYINEDDIYQK